MAPRHAMLHNPVLFLVLASALALLPSDPRSQPGKQAGMPYMCDQLCRTLTYWGGYHNPTRFQCALPTAPRQMSPCDLYSNCFQQNFFFGPNTVSIPFSESSSDLPQPKPERATCSAEGDRPPAACDDNLPIRKDPLATPGTTQMCVEKPSTTPCPDCFHGKQSFDLPSATLFRKQTTGGSTADPSDRTSTIQVTTIQPNCLPKKCDVCQTSVPPIRRYSAEIPADPTETPPTEPSARVQTSSPPYFYPANEYSSRIPSYENIPSYMPPVFKHFSDFCLRPYEVVFPANETATICNGKPSKTTVDRPFFAPPSCYRPQPKCIIFIPKYTCRPVTEFNCPPPRWSGVRRDNCVSTSPEFTVNRICHHRNGKDTVYFTDPDERKKNGYFENADIYFEEFPTSANEQRKDSKGPATPKPSYLTPVRDSPYTPPQRTDDVGLNSSTGAREGTVITPPLQTVYSHPEPKRSYLTPIADMPYVPVVQITPNNSISDGNYNPLDRKETSTPREKENTYNFPVSDPSPDGSPIFNEHVNSSTSNNPMLKVDTTDWETSNGPSNPNTSIEHSAEY